MCSGLWYARFAFRVLSFLPPRPHRQAGNLARKVAEARLMGGARHGGASHAHAKHCFAASLPNLPYTPSSIELAWLHEPVLGHICKIGHLPEQIEATATWLDYAKSVWEGGPVSTPTSTQRRVLSAFEVDDGMFDPIEPLTGIGRHPNYLHSMLCESTDKRHRWNQIPFKYDLQYLVLANACPSHHGAHRGGDSQNNGTMCLRRPAGARNRFYDLGSALPFGNAPLRDEDLKHGGDLCPSIATFRELYSRRCIDFDEYYAWESQPYSASVWWARVPVDLRAKMRFYNVPVMEGSPEEARNGTYRGNDSFLSLLLASARPDDFVVVKVDIEGQMGAPEMAIVQSIGARPELSALVDEIFFECHFYSIEHSTMPGGYPNGWGAINRTTSPSVDDALKLMYKLRQRGIRSHFWI